MSHPWVAEAAVVGANDEITGQAVVAFVIIRSDVTDVPEDGKEVATALRNHVRKQIGPLAKPREILVVAEVPKTRFGEDHAPPIARRRREPRCRRRHYLAGWLVMDAIKEGLAAGRAD